MIISKVNLLSKNRYEIYIDEKLAFVLYKGELCKYGIKAGLEISEELYSDIVKNTLYKRALLRCSHLLERRDYTSYELYKKLKDGAYPLDAADYAINKLISYGYVNDESYARRYIESYISSRSLNRIKQDLYKKGIKSDIFDKAWNILSEDGIEVDEEGLINKLLEKRHYFDKISDIKNNEGSRDDLVKEYNKQFNYLMTKGFKSENIKKALKI